MDQFVSGVISGVVANAITAFYSYAWTRGQPPQREREKLPRALEADGSLLPIIQKAEAALAASTLITTKRNAEKLRIILVSPAAGRAGVGPRQVLDLTIATGVKGIV